MSNAGLSQLGYYGGPIQTIALLPGSPAIGQDSLQQGQTDERGFARPTSAQDIGAFQTQASLVVNTTVDGSGAVGQGQLSLRDAVNLADVDATVAAQFISFDSRVFASAQTIDLTAGPLVFSAPNFIGIFGTSAGVTIEGNGQSDALVVESGTSAELSGLTICDSLGVTNYGSLTVYQCTVTGEFTNNDGGAIANYGNLIVLASTFSNDSAFLGGAIANYGSANISSSTFSNDSAFDGGAIWNDSTLTASGDTFSGNGGYWNGGAVFNWANATLQNCLFEYNQSGSGGAIANWAGTLTVSSSTFNSDSASYGGGIYNLSTLTVNSSTFNSDSASYGGGIDNANVFTGNADNFWSCSAYQGGGLYNTGSANLSGGSDLYGDTASYGGAILNWGILTLNADYLYFNSAIQGGAIYNGGALTLDNSDLLFNSLQSAAGSGAAVFTVPYSSSVNQLGNWLAYNTTAYGASDNTID